MLEEQEIMKFLMVQYHLPASAACVSISYFLYQCNMRCELFHQSIASEIGSYQMNRYITYHISKVYFIYRNTLKWLPKEKRNYAFLHEKVSAPMLNSPKALSYARKGVNYTIMKLEQRDATGMGHYFLSAICGTV